MLTDVPSRIVRNPGRYAVMLNANAKRWTGELHQSVLRWVSARDLYLTDDFRQAERTVDRLVAEDYEAIFTGGGDGTIVYLMNAIEQRIQEGKVARKDAPPVGVLRMGTGNAIATWLECGNIVDDLRTLRSGAPLVIYELDMIESGANAFPFAGFGWDAFILNDYDAFKAAVRDTAVENFATGLGGYAASIASRTIPRAILEGSTIIRITALDHAIQIDAQGRAIAEFDADDVIFEGPIKITSCSSIPYWGFNVRMFPHAVSRRGYFQVRTFNGSVRSILAHLPSFWRGEVTEGTHDFMCRHVRVDVLERPLSYQVAGDPEGTETSVEWKTTEHPRRLAVPLR
jgi:diacylglycerol kinase family enzyme